jgi:hypothetical protein
MQNWEEEPRGHALGDLTSRTGTQSGGEKAGTCSGGAGA